MTSVLQATPRGAANSDSDRRISLLLIDDDELDRLSVRRLLKADGLRADLVECGDAEFALAALARRTFDCVLLDYHLPRHDGLFVLTKLRELGVKTPVLMLTGQDSPDVAAELMKAGASDYLAKDSLTPRRLGHGIRQALQVARLEEEARLSAEALRSTEELNRRIISASLDSICVLSVDGRVLSVNDSSRRLLGGRDISAVLGQPWADFWPHPEAALRALEEARQGDPGRFLEMCPGPMGEPIWWDVAVTPVLGTEGGTDKILCVARDVTEHKRRQEFEQQLVGIVSHDLRNPLNAILLACELIQKRGTDDKTARSVGQVKTAATRAARMIHDLLDFTRARLSGSLVVDLKPANLSEVAAQVVDEVMLAWPGRAVHLHNRQPVRGSFDPDRMAQVLTNLVTNALQYSPPEETVTITVGIDRGAAVVEVHNRGAPIPVEVLPTIFEPLQRGTTAGSTARSIGLGLYIVRHVVTAHGGTVHAQSDAAMGTRFVVRIPLQPSAEPSLGGGRPG